MISRRFLLAATSVAAAILLRAAITGMPETLVGTHFRYGPEASKTNISFLADSVFQVKQANAVLYDGFYTPRRDGDVWSVAATRRDGSITYLYSLRFLNATSGVASVTVATRGTHTSNFILTDGTEPPPPPPPVTNNAPATLGSMFVTNTFSAAGPSHYRIDFSGGSTGTFVIQRPGYGTGNFAYTSGSSTGLLVMNYSGDLAGDRDELSLQFNGTNAATLHNYTGLQLISGREEPIAGVFTHLPAGAAE